MNTRSPRKTPTFETWMVNEVKSLIGRSRPPGDIEKLCELLAGNLPEEHTAHKDAVNRHNVLAVLKELMRDVMKVLRDAAAARMSKEKVYALLKRHLRKDSPDFPQWVVEELLKEMHGRVSAPHEKVDSAVSGINRLPLDGAKERDLKPTSFKEPFHALADVKSDKFKIAFLNSLQIGLPYDPDIYRNLTRCGFSAARKTDCDAIVIGGRLLHIELKKRSGPSRLVDDVLTGTAIDFATFADDYRDEAEQNAKPDSVEPIFQTAEERLLNRLRGLFKVTRRPRLDGEGTIPEFKKPVYVILGPDDLKVVEAAAHFHLLYLQMKRWLEANAEARERAKEAGVFLKLLKDGHDVQTEYNEASAAAAKAAAKATRFRMSNLHETKNKAVLGKVLGYFIEKIEEAIPNSKVIAQNVAHMRFGQSKDVIEVISSDKSVHINEIKSHGPKQRKGELPALTISMHPGAVYPRKGSRENYVTKGKMLGTVGFFEAPMLVDKDAILKAMGGWGSKQVVAKAVLDPMFVGGMSIVTIDPRFMPNADVLPTDVVRKYGQPRKEGEQRNSRTSKKYVWLWLATDPHLGAANRLFLKTKQGVPIGICEAGFELMSQSGVNRNGLTHVSGIFFCDDLTQGNHFGTHMRPHHNQRTNAEIWMQVDAELKRLRELANGKLRERGKDSLISMLTSEFAARPPHHWGSQLKEFWRAVLDAYEPVFKGVLLRAREQGVIVRGISHYTNAIEDARDVGLINFGSGNHATKTLDSAAFEGEIVADRLQVALRKDPDVKGIDLRALIRGPMHQDQSIGYGTLQVGEKGKTWGLHVAGTPPKRDSWYDLLHGWVQVNRQRGDTSTLFGGEGMPIVHMTGDKHFFGYASAGGDQYVMGPSSTHTDAFADIAGGLPANNPGLAFIGLPVDGPDEAEVIVKHLTPKELQDFLSSGEDFPWEDFLPNRA